MSETGFEPKQRICVAFSGGRSSGRMVKLMKDNQTPDQEIIYVFNNTGQEDERVLNFVRRCDEEWGLNLVMLEAVVQEGRKGSTFKVVDYQTANFDGEPFKQMVAKYGLPNKSYPHCNRELKLNPTREYLRSIGWSPGSYDTAIGIRADEVDRVSIRAKEKRLIYPLIKAFIRKEEVYSFWRSQPWDLYHPEHLGNCRWCWKKSLRKHLTIAVEHPEVFDFPRMLETEFAHVKPERGSQQMFRQGMTTLDIFNRAKQPFEKFVDGREAFDPDLDSSGGSCGTESCEIDGDDDDQQDMFTRLNQEEAKLKARMPHLWSDYYD